MTETPDEKRERHLAEYDHTHDITGNFIPRSQTQDAISPKCPDCGLNVYGGHPDAEQNTRPFNHKIGCVNYQPHPVSIAAQNV